MRAHPSYPVRLVSAAALAVTVALAGAGLVAAKMPFFSVEVVPQAPAANEPVLVVVRMWADPEHTSPAGWDLGPTMENLLVFRSADRMDWVPLTLQRVEQDRYEARVTLPAGDWSLVAFPDRTGWATTDVPAGYPDTIAVTVREPGPDLRAIVLPLVGLGLLVLAGVYSRNRLRSAALTRSSSVEFTPTSASAARDASRASPIE